MTRELVLIHGRSQQGKDSIALKKEWIDTLKQGLAKSSLTLPIPEEKIRFPFFGDTLDGLVQGQPAEQVAKIVIRGAEGGEDPELRAFVARVLEEIADQHGITDEQKMAAANAAAAANAEPVVIDRGPLNWGWVQGLLMAIDRHVPGGSGLSIGLATRDVYLYLTNSRIRRQINDGVRGAMTPGVESVVVGHSLGTIVSYWMLAQDGQQRGWNVPLYITVGSPLGVTAIKEALRREFGIVKHPVCARKWFNAMDPDDVVALYPLDMKNFPLDPEIENKIDVDNQTDNQHGIAGYLNDKDVAKRIHDALIA